MISIIVSVSENWIIGKNNKLLWKQSDDLKRFKNLTNDHAIIMGQKTFESLPNGALPNRTNIVITDDKDFTGLNIFTVNSLDEAIIKAKFHTGENSEIFIIGGGSIYRQFLNIADKIYLTVIHTIVDGDVSFPNIDEMKEWEKEKEEKIEKKDDKNEFDTTFKIYKRI